MTGVVCRLMKPRTRCDRQGTPLSPLDAPGTRLGEVKEMQPQTIFGHTLIGGCDSRGIVTVFDKCWFCQQANTS